MTPIGLGVKGSWVQIPPSRHTAVPTTAVPTTAVPTTAVPTTAVPTNRQGRLRRNHRWSAARFHSRSPIPWGSHRMELGIVAS